MDNEVVLTEEELDDRDGHFATAAVTEEEFKANKTEILRKMGYTDEEIAEM